MGVLQHADPQIACCQAMIVSPTRELALQTMKLTEAIGKYIRLKFSLLVGGTAVGQSLKTASTCQIIIGTAGRIIDTLNRAPETARTVRLLVLDEVDELTTG